MLPKHAPVLFVLLAAAFLARVAPAQCPFTPTDVFVESSACNNGPRVNWTLPPGQLYFPRVFRSLTPNFADATLVVAAALLSTSAVDEGAPANVDLYYWVQFQGINPPCTFSEFAGPVLGRRINLGGTTFVVPPPTATVLCNGVRIDWLRIRENAGQSMLLRRIASNPIEQVDFPITPGVSTFTDTTGTPGRQYGYYVFYFNTCRGTEGTELVLTDFPRTIGTAAPVGTDVLSGSVATLSATFVGQIPGVQSVLWFKGDSLTPVQLSSRVQMQGLDLRFSPVLESDAGLYRARGVTLCGNLADIQVGLVVRKACPADFNASGSVSVQDVFDFLTAFFSSCP